MIENINDLERNRLFKKIFVYHALTTDREFQQVWVDDLKSYFTKEIEYAWNQWRKEELNENKKPKSWDLVRIIKAERRKKIIPDNKPDILRKGISISQDRLLNDLEAIRQNNPNLMKEIAACEHPYEKILVCAVAMGKSTLMNEPVMKMIIKKLNNPESIKFDRQIDFPTHQLSSHRVDTESIS